MYYQVAFHVRDMIKKIINIYLEQNKAQYTPEEYQNVLDVMEKFQEWLYHAMVDRRD